MRQGLKIRCWLPLRCFRVVCILNTTMTSTIKRIAIRATAHGDGAYGFVLAGIIVEVIISNSFSWSYRLFTAPSTTVTFKLHILSSCLWSSHMSWFSQMWGDISFLCSSKLISIAIVYISVRQLSYIFRLCNKPAFDHIELVLLDPLHHMQPAARGQLHY